MSKFVNEILIHDNVDQEEKYLLTTTKTLNTRIVDRASWEKIRNGRADLLPLEILEDLKKNLLIIPEREDELAGLGGLDSPFGFLDKEMNLSLRHLPEARVLMDELRQGGKDFLDLQWTRIENLEDVKLFKIRSAEIQELAKAEKKFLRGRISTSCPELLPSLQELHEKFFITHLEVYIPTAKAVLHDECWELLSQKIKDGRSSLYCQINLQVDYRRLDKVGPILRKISTLDLQDQAEVLFTLVEDGEAPLSLDQKKEFAGREIEFLIELYNMGLPLPPLRPSTAGKKVTVAPSSSSLFQTGNPYDCQDCEILPVCGGHAFSWNEENPPCPVLKFNLKEKILLKYLFQGPKCVDL